MCNCKKKNKFLTDLKIEFDKLKEKTEILEKALKNLNLETQHSLNTPLNFQD